MNNISVRIILILWEHYCTVSNRSLLSLSSATVNGHSVQEVQFEKLLDQIREGVKLRYVSPELPGKHSAEREDTPNAYLKHY